MPTQVFAYLILGAILAAQAYFYSKNWPIPTWLTALGEAIAVGIIPPHLLKTFTAAKPAAPAVTVNLSPPMPTVAEKPPTELPK